jgi:chromosome segregation ATPase
MIHSPLATFLTYCADGDVGRSLRLRLAKLKRAIRRACERAAIKTEVSQAKEAVDLLRMAHAIARLDRLEAEIEVAKKVESGRRAKARPLSGRPDQ